jgi:hypothetical protein
MWEERDEGQTGRNQTAGQRPTVHRPGSLHPSRRRPRRDLNLNNWANKPKSREPDEEIRLLGLIALISFSVENK